MFALEKIWLKEEKKKIIIKEKIETRERETKYLRLRLVHRLIKC
jgi:hypothetical protein